MTVPVRVLRIARSIAWFSLRTSVISGTSQTLAWHSSAARIGRGPAPAWLRSRGHGRGRGLAIEFLEVDLGQDLGQVVTHVPDLAMVLELAGCHLKAQVEELLTGVLQLLLQIGHGESLEIFHLHFFPPPFAGFAGAAAFGAAAALGAAPGAAFMVGAAPGAAFGPLAAGAAAAPPAVGAAIAPAIPSTPSPGFTSAGPLILISTAAFTPDLMPSVRVFMGSLYAASWKARFAISGVTPPISKRTRPGLMTATQPSGAPLPLPMRVSAGFLVTDLSGKTRMNTWPPRRTNRVITRRAASICRFDIQAASEACRPNSPKARSLPWVATPVRRPRWTFRYLTRAGRHMPIPSSLARGRAVFSVRWSSLRQSWSSRGWCAWVSRHRRPWWSPSGCGCASAWRPG